MAKKKEVIKLIPVPASMEFIDELRRALIVLRYTTRSQFIRDAIVEKFQKHGLKFPRELANPPMARRRQKELEEALQRMRQHRRRRPRGVV